MDDLEIPRGGEGTAHHIIDCLGTVTGGGGGGFIPGSGNRDEAVYDVSVRVKESSDVMVVAGEDETICV